MLELTKQEELKEYLFIWSKGDVILPVCQVFAALAYNQDGAILELKQGLDSQFPINFRLAGAVEVKEILNKVDETHKKCSNLKVEVKKMNKDNFIASLKLTRDKFIQNDKDKKSFDRIIKNLCPKKKS